MSSICKVNKCRFSDCHVTSRHKCGTCKQYGHGQTECANFILKQSLYQYDNDKIESNCTIEDCIDCDTHVTSGHSCRYCESLIGHLLKCPINGIDICDKLQDNNFDIINRLNKHATKYKLNKGQYILLRVEMGCAWYIRSNQLTGDYEYLFMDADCYGQYGKDTMTNDLPRLNAFIYNYILIASE